MKTTCRICGIVDKPHRCPHSKKEKYRADNRRQDKKLYTDKRYRSVRDQVMDDFDHVCLWSLYVVGKIVAANEAHHIVEVLEDEALAFDYENLIPLSYLYHKPVVHELYKRDKAGTQKILRLMRKDYLRGDRTIGKYSKYFNTPPTFE